MNNYTNGKNEAIANKIIEWFKEHEEFFNEAIEQLDWWNGYLGDDKVIPMSELDEFYCNIEPSEILVRAFFGYDGDCYETDKNGYRNYNQPFNPMREYFYYNGYGNLVSTDYIDYTDRLDTYFVDEIADNITHIDCIYDGFTEESDEIADLFNQYNGFETDIRI